MTAKRAYCLKDKPSPVSRRAMGYLARMDGVITVWWCVSDAPRIYERLRLGGYVHIDDGMARITDAGRALLRDALEETRDED